MKQLLLIGLVLLASCNPAQDRDPNYVAPKPKFEENTLVYVGDTEYIVYTSYGVEDNRTYRLQKVDCRSEDCLYYVKESEITKQKRSEIAMEKLMSQDTSLNKL